MRPYEELLFSFPHPAILIDRHHFVVQFNNAAFNLLGGEYLGTPVSRILSDNGDAMSLVDWRDKLVSFKGNPFRASLISFGEEDSDACNEAENVTNIPDIESGAPYRVILCTPFEYTHENETMRALTSVSVTLRQQTQSISSLLQMAGGDRDRVGDLLAQTRQINYRLMRTAGNIDLFIRLNCKGVSIAEDQVDLAVLCDDILFSNALNASLMGVNLDKKIEDNIFLKADNVLLTKAIYNSFVCALLDPIPHSTVTLTTQQIVQDPEKDTKSAVITIKFYSNDIDLTTIPAFSIDFSHVKIDFSPERAAYKEIFDEQTIMLSESLFLIKRIAELHGGKLLVSCSNKLNTISISLPVDVSYDLTVVEDFKFKVQLDESMVELSPLRLNTALYMVNVKTRNAESKG